MKYPLLVATLFLAVFSDIPNAAAFSTDEGANLNSDGSPKYTDPDEQVRGFMVAPERTGAEDHPLSFDSAPVTVPNRGDNTSGARAFDQAFAHQQDKE